MSDDLVIDLNSPSQEAADALKEILDANGNVPWYWQQCSARLACSAECLMRSARIAAKKLQAISLAGPLTPRHGEVLLRAEQTPVAEMLYAMAIEARLKALFAAEGRIREAYKLGHQLLRLADNIGVCSLFDHGEQDYLKKAELALELGRFPSLKGKALEPGVPVAGLGGLDDATPKRILAKIERAYQAVQQRQVP